MRKMGRIQAYYYWSEQYHNARVLYDTLRNLSASADHASQREQLYRLRAMAQRRMQRLYDKAESFAQPVPRKRAA